jgi:F420-0:gamma-glutamyl ligase
MIISSIKTPRITPGLCTLQQLLDETISAMPDQSVLAITSKVVSLCEGAVVPISGTDKKVLIQKQADYYLPDDESMYGISFTITQQIGRAHV